MGYRRAADVLAFRLVAGGRTTFGKRLSTAACLSSCGSSMAEHRIVDPKDVGSSPIRSATLASVCYSRIDRREATPNELEDRAIMFMRYINLAIGEGSFIPLAP